MSGTRELVAETADQVTKPALSAEALRWQGERLCQLVLDEGWGELEALDMVEAERAGRPWERAEG